MEWKLGINKLTHHMCTARSINIYTVSFLSINLFTFQLKKEKSCSFNIATFSNPLIFPIDLFRTLSKV